MTEDPIEVRLRQNNYLDRICFPSADGLSPIYRQNLEEIFRYLVDSIRIRGFSNTSVGESTDTIYGFAICRGDIPADICRNCIAAAIERVKIECPSNSSAMIWFEACFLRFSSKRFLGIFEPKFPVVWTDNSQLFAKSDGMEWVYPLVKEAADNSKRFATMIEPKGGYTSYSLAQCTIDLSSADCSACFQYAMKEIGNNHTLGRVWRFACPSCAIFHYTWPFFFTSPGSKKGNQRRTVIIISSTAGILLLAMGTIVLHFHMRKRKRLNEELRKYNCEMASLMSSLTEDERNHELPQYSLRTMQAATNNFSNENKLGRGGFGHVYKGELNGRLVAVKRLSERSGQGLKEFMNEVTLIAKLQHKNLVCLLGCCVEREEKMLIYEFMPNGSLDAFLYDPEKRKSLDWKKRCKIIMGSARGILYLHQDSRLNIIHRDLKAGNILLDEHMTAKISDFGMARIFSGDHDPKTTDIVVGTYGYMAPEYAIDGKFSVKSDVYSFGVLLLEIISGQTYGGFDLPLKDDTLPQYAWNQWRTRRTSDFIDPMLGETASTSEILKCYHIGLLCVQEDPASRPTMSAIINMLESDSPTLPTPQRPPLVFSSDSSCFSTSGTITGSSRVAVEAVLKMSVANFFA
ncbi:cysteine-rich receptor-like protein kinase 44 isoform X2 [Nymphaea colorata]|nr:cysteine-rich receptor-like protein kinase 44 isoform X2 [Nymphaea colorata]